MAITWWKISQKLKSIPFLESTEKELSIGIIHNASSISGEQTIGEMWNSLFFQIFTEIWIFCYEFQKNGH